MPASYSRSSSSRRARRKVLQQLTEELRAEYMEGKQAAAGGTRWAAAEATTAAAADAGHLKCHKPECGNCEESGGSADCDQ